MHVVAQRCVCLIYRGIGGSQVDWGGVGIAILVAHTSRTTSASYRLFLPKCDSLLPASPSIIMHSGAMCQLLCAHTRA